MGDNVIIFSRGFLSLFYPSSLNQRYFKEKWCFRKVEDCLWIHHQVNYGNIQGDKIQRKFLKVKWRALCKIFQNNNIGLRRLITRWFQNERQMSSLNYFHVRLLSYLLWLLWEKKKPTKATGGRKGSFGSQFQITVHQTVELVLELRSCSHRTCSPKVDQWMLVLSLFSPLCIVQFLSRGNGAPHSRPVFLLLKEGHGGQLW